MDRIVLLVLWVFAVPFLSAPVVFGQDGCLCTEVKQGAADGKAYSHSGDLYFYWKNYAAGVVPVDYRVTDLSGRKVVSSSERPYFAAYGSSAQRLPLKGFCEEGKDYILAIRSWNGVSRSFHFVHRSAGGGAVRVAAEKVSGSCSGKKGLTARFSAELSGEGPYDLDWYVSDQPFGLPGKNWGSPVSSERGVAKAAPLILSDASGVYVLLNVRDACGGDASWQERVVCVSGGRFSLTVELPSDRQASGDKTGDR